MKQIKTALITVFNKDGIDEIAKLLHKLGADIYSTGGTAGFIEKLDVPVITVETLTGYPSILGGRVKTLHPKVFGGILSRRGNEADQKDMEKYEIPEMDLVIVDLYPFEKTVESGASHSEVVEKIDIGGISLIRAAAKNYKDVVIISAQYQYPILLSILEKNGAQTSSTERFNLCCMAFEVTSGYDTAIKNYFGKFTE
ncbi:IMP cyclohydrolase [Patescibacteria group bacterium]|nr:IMP cyclohydrolase [Patescibacteria group bacterium]MBU1758113.1 IMP cyclohydrolase [Patescibacteria group bacterium]